MSKPRKDLGWRPNWRFPTHVETAVKKFLLPPTLHVCSGKSQLGEVRVDLYEKSDVTASMLKLPFRGSCFETVLCDPPYTSSPLNFVLLGELDRVLKTGGLLVFVHYFDAAKFFKKRHKRVFKEYWEPPGFKGVRIISVSQKVQTVLSSKMES